LLQRGLAAAERRGLDDARIFLDPHGQLAIDAGEIRAGEAVTPIREAELELVSGDAGDLYRIARRLFSRGPVRFSLENKSARGYRLARGEPDPSALPRNASVPDYAASASVETVARDIFRDCLAQIAQNMVVVADSDDAEGPHQLRVGLRRLRTAFGVFGPSLGKDALTPLSDEAQRLGKVVGSLRDIDVLIGEVVAEAAGTGLDAEAREQPRSHDRREFILVTKGAPGAAMAPTALLTRETTPAIEALTVALLTCNCAR